MRRAVSKEARELLGWNLGGRMGPESEIGTQKIYRDPCARSGSDLLVIVAAKAPISNWICHLPAKGSPHAAEGTRMDQRRKGTRCAAGSWRSLWPAGPHAVPSHGLACLICHWGKDKVGSHSKGHSETLRKPLRSLDRVIQNRLTLVRQICMRPDMIDRAVAYYRVSTAKQGSSGLGLEAQRHAVETFCAARGWELIAPPFVEVESGKRDDRPELDKALERSRLTGAMLVVAKLDRLSRDLHFLTKLQKDGARFVAVDMPEANELTVHIMAAVAQAERKATSRRTREALAAAKARGVRLGNPNGAAAFRRAGKGTGAALEAVSANATLRAERLSETVRQLQAQGVQSLGGLAAALNEQGIVTARGGRWHASSVRNLLARIVPVSE